MSIYGLSLATLWGPGIDVGVLLFTLSLQSESQDREENRQLQLTGISHVIRNRVLWQLRRDMSNPTMFCMGEQMLCGAWREVTVKI